MDSVNSALKKVSVVSVIALSVLFLMSIFFYKERIFFSDAAYILFNIINTKSLYIQEHRYGSVITQVVPYLGEKLHLPLKAIVIGYAVSFNLFYLLVVAILYRCRQYAFALLTGFFYLLLISSSYFWICNEINQAVAWMFLMFGLTLYHGNKKTNLLTLALVFTPLALTTIYTHLVVVIPTVFIWVYLILEKKNWPFTKRDTLVLSSILVLAIVIKYVDANARAQSYDSMHLHGIRTLSLSDIIAAFDTPVISVFLSNCLTNYWLAVIVFVCGIVALFRNKQVWPAIWTIISVLGYFILMGIVYGDLDEHFQQFHIESEWASIGILTAMGFVFSFLPSLKTKYALLIVALIFMVRIGYICSASRPFTLRNRVNLELADKAKKKGINKLALINDSGLMSINMLYWGLPYEILMQSAIKGETPQQTLFFVNNDDKKTKEAVSNTNGFYNSFILLGAQDMNTFYFKIDTTHPYTIMTYQQLSQ